MSPFDAALQGDIRQAGVIAVLVVDELEQVVPLMKALAEGCRLLKFFPAEGMGGLPFLSSVAGPYKHLGVQFVPLGGLHIENMKAYLASPLVAALGGSWIAPRSLIQSGDWETIYTNADKAMQYVAEKENT